MADVKWIKICTDIFDDEKITLIESMPDADGIIVIWFKLLCLAGKQNNGGVFMLNDKIAYTDEMLATIFRKPLNTVRLALKTFESFGMIEVVNDAYTIPNWEKHQSLDKLEKAKENNRLRVQKYREKQKQLAFGGVNVCQYCGNEATGIDHIIPISRGGKDIESNIVPCCIECNRKKNDKPLVDFLNSHRSIINDDIVTSNKKLSKFVTLCNVTGHYIVTPYNATEEDIEEDIEKDKDKEVEKKEKCQKIVDIFNSLCPSFPKVKFLSDSMISNISNLVERFPESDISTAFQKCEKSSFLKGNNPRKWKASFDWIIKPQNLPKILNGNYDDEIASDASYDLSEFRRKSLNEPLKYERNKKK